MAIYERQGLTISLSITFLFISMLHLKLLCTAGFVYHLGSQHLMAADYSVTNDHSPIGNIKYPQVLTISEYQPTPDQPLTDSRSV